MFLLTLRETLRIPLDFTGILPERLEGKSVADVESMEIGLGNRRVQLGEFFDVKPRMETKIGRDQIRIDGDCSCVKNIGAGMTKGHIWMRGSAGPHAGSRMKGGMLAIAGNAGDWLGAEMSGGSIHVRDNVGSQVGGAYRGSRKGMTGGIISIEANVGDEVGLLMRRGTIRIRGNCGDFAGVSMIAGTIFVHGTLGSHAGAGMKRGTIVSTQPPPLSPGFRFACEYGPQYMHLLNEQFRGTGREVIDQENDLKSVKCYRGDLLTGGRGEIWEVIR